MRRAAPILALAFLLSAPVFAVDTGRLYPQYQVRNNSVTAEGRITSINQRNGGKYDVTLDTGGVYTVSKKTMRREHLQVGQLVRFDGYTTGRGVNVENVTYSTDPNWNTRQPMISSSVNGNFMTGIVESTNRRLNYVTIRDGRGQLVKIDVRDMDTRRSVNVWNLRPGDRVSVNGAWENSDTYRANTVNF